MTALMVRDDCLICLFLEACQAQAECRVILDIFLVPVEPGEFV